MFAERLTLKPRPLAWSTTPYEDPWHNAPNYTAQWLKHAKVYDRYGEQLVAEMRTHSDIPHPFPDLESMRQHYRLPRQYIHDI
jgi:hypothetical protein